MRGRLTALGLAIALGVLPARAWSVEATGPTSAALGIQAAEDDPAERGTVAVPIPSAKAVRYHRSGLWIWAFARLWDVALPALILFTGLSGRMRDLARQVVRVSRISFLGGRGRGHPRGEGPCAPGLEDTAPATGTLKREAQGYPTVALYVVLYLALTFLADLPLRYFAGFIRQHEYGLSNQPLAKWFGDSVKSLGVDVVGGVLFAWVPFWLIRRYPRRWWLILSGLMVPFIAFVMLIAPVWIDPLFNDFGPMKDRALERKILALAQRSGISGGRVFEVNKSVDTKTVNAYVKGLLGTHRIVLWDTLLKNFEEREVLVVMGHEMGHYVLHHVGWSIGLSTVLLLAGLFWTDRAGRWVVARFRRRIGFDSLSDVAATPLLLILVALSSLALAPVALAYSRHNEHEADRFAVELTRMNRSAARAFVDLQRDNLGVPRHGLLERLWRDTHPTSAERIEFANTYRPWAAGRPLRYGSLFAH
jgi:Zn-dependent protease with chaperone function